MLDDVSEIRYFQDSYENIILIWLNFKPANNNNNNNHLRILNVNCQWNEHVKAKSDHIVKGYTTSEYL